MRSGVVRSFSLIASHGNATFLQIFFFIYFDYFESEMDGKRWGGLSLDVQTQFERGEFPGGWRLALIGWRLPTGDWRGCSTR